MKKVCITIFAAVSTMAACAQVQFGVKAGLNLSTLNYSGPDSGSPAYKTSFNAGAFASIPLFTSFYLQPEMMYSGQGFEETIFGQPTQFETGYLNVPVLFKYQHETGLFAETGPQVGFLLSAKNNVAGISYDVKSSYETTDFSWALGIGYQFTGIGLGIDARYNLGLTNIAKESQNGTYKNSVFQLGLFYAFNFNK
jgi:hypothetical protein